VAFGLRLTSLFFDLQLEVLGRSLFWDNICKRIEYDSHIQDSPPASVVQHINPATSAHSQQTVPSSQNTPATTSQSFDLLSGWEEPEVVQTSSKNTNPFLNDGDLVDTATNPFLSWDPFAPPTSETTTHGLEGEWHNQQIQITNPQTKAISPTAAADYIEIVKSFLKSDPVRCLHYCLFGHMFISCLFIENLIERTDSYLSLPKYAISWIDI
jgi:hypothetical protein